MNPSGQPFNPMMGPPPPGMNAVRDAVNVPGILLIVFGVLTIGSGLVSLVSSLLMGSNNQALLDQFSSNPNLPPAFKDFAHTMAGSGGKAMNILSNLITLGFGGVMALGGFQMRNLKAYPLAMAASIVSMMPCTCCCMLTLPVGIWCLVTIMKPEVKAAFT